MKRLLDWWCGHRAKKSDPTVWSEKLTPQQHACRKCGLTFYDDTILGHHEMFAHVKDGWWRESGSQQCVQGRPPQ